MSRFSEQWLALREGADARARSKQLLPALEHWLQSRSSARDETRTALNILDLGCGTGSNLRWLAPRIATPQHWTLIDNDPLLLAQAARSLDFQVDSKRHTGQEVSAKLMTVDLARQLPSLDGTHLLSASALLDLVSRHWLLTLVEQAAQRNIGLLFTLNYDGRLCFTPSHPVDALIRDALNRDQLNDKGFGPALGPECIAALHGTGIAHGYRVCQWRSDWCLDGKDKDLQARLIDDLAATAERQARSASADLDAIWSWRRWRHARIGHSNMRVGHVDVLALPRDTDRLSATSTSSRR